MTSFQRTKKIVFAFLSFAFLCIPSSSGQGDTLFRTIIHNDLTRYYILYVPVAYEGIEAWPLVINLHGYSSFPFQQMVLSDMNVVADTGHFLVVYPEGTMFKSTSSTLNPQGLGWNNGLPSDTTIYTEHPVDDVDFISNLIDSINAEYPVDLARVYATGLSNGAVMSNVLACELSERIAAIAPVAGTAHPGRVCTPARKVPVLQIHGTADAITDYETGNAEIRMGAPDYLDLWIELNGCSPGPTVLPFPDLVINDNSTVERHTWQDCGEELIHYKVIDGGHIWPGFDFSFFPELGNSNLDINASSEIWNFFKLNSIKILVCPDDVVLSVQEEVNLFNCTKVEGNLTISGADITDLSPLTVLDSVEGNLLIELNDILTNLDGMNNLVYVGGRLSISGNDSLTSIDALSHLSFVGGALAIGRHVPYFQLQGNDELTTLEGLHHLKSIKGNVDILGNDALTNLQGLRSLIDVKGNFILAGNNSLTDLNGLTSLIAIDGSLLIGGTGFFGHNGNDGLINLDGLSGLLTVAGDISIMSNIALTSLDGLSQMDSMNKDLDIISNNALTNLNGLENLVYIAGELAIAGNDALTDLDALSNLTSVGGDLTIGRWFGIGGNLILSDLDGLSHLTSVGGDVSIIDNPALTSLNGLTGIDAVGDELEIGESDVLTSLKGLDNISSVKGYLSIHNNASLTNLDALENLVSVGGYLEIRNNESLTSCRGIHQLLCTDPPDCTSDAVDGSITIQNNPFACNSKEDIIASLTQGWDTTGLKRMPTPRVGCTASVLDGKIYVIGGKFTRDGPPTSTVEIYDPVENAWDTTLINLPNRLYEPVSEVVDGKLYVMGGDIAGVPVAVVYEYDPKNPGIWEKKENIPVARQWHSSSVVNDSIYLIGGFPLLDSTLMYIPAADEWIIKNKLPSPKVVLSSETVGDAIYAMGGLYSLEVYSEVLEYSPREDTWVEKTSMPKEKMGARSAVLDSNIYVFGGWSSYPWPDLPGDFSPGTWKYHTPTDSWENVLADLPDESIGFASAVAVGPDGKKCIYAFGGTLPDYYEQGGGPQVSDRVIKLCGWSCSIAAEIDTNDGSIDITVTAGNPPFCYSIDNGMTTQSNPLFTNLSSGTYNVVVAEETGCKFQQQVELVISAAHSEIESDQAITVNPNPFNASTTIRYNLKAGTNVNIKIFNLAGQEITKLINAYQMPGEHEIEWHANGLPPGVYLYSFQTETVLRTGKCTLIH